MSPNDDIDGGQISSTTSIGLTAKLNRLLGRSDFSGEADGRTSPSADEDNAGSVKPLKIPKRGKTLKYLLSAAVLVSFFGIIVFIYIPQQQQKSRQQSRLVEVGNQSIELKSRKAELANEIVLLEQTKERFNLLKARAYSQKELDRLFGNISYLANEYELLIDRIEQQSRQSDSLSTNAAIDFSQIEIHLNVSGKYLNYLSFRRALFGANKAIDIANEKIEVLPNSNYVQVVGVLKVYLISGEESL